MAMALVACQQPACNIDGELEQLACDEGKVYLQVMDDQTMQLQILDSTVVRNGKFHFAYNGIVPKTGMVAVLKDGKNVWGTQFIVEPGRVFLQADDQGYARIGGTLNNDLLQKHLELQN